MLRRRSSIKGIGASIFYDVEDPERDASLKNGKTDWEYDDAETPDFALDSAVQATRSDLYDTGALIALLEGQPGRNGGRFHHRGDDEDKGADRQNAELTGDKVEPLDVDGAPLSAKAASERESAPLTVDAELSIPYNPQLPNASSEQQTAAPSPIGDLKALSPEQEERARKRLGEQAFVDLLSQVEHLYAQVASSLSTREGIARQSMDLLSEARDLLLLGDASDFNLAERRLNEVRMTLSRVEQTRRWANTYGWGLFVYEMALCVVFVAVLLFDQHIAEWISLMTGTYTVVNGVAELTKAMTAIFPPWNTMVWGGIGGVVGALYSLHWHVAELQDFDKQYSLWYVVQPLMGLILGGIIHLVIVTGLLALIPINDPSAGPAIAVQWFPALVACLAGFRQKFTYELLDSIMKALGRQPAK